MINFEELDSVTRKIMLEEFDSEQSGGKAYLSKALSDLGRRAFPRLMRKAISDGHVVSLATELAASEYWNEEESYERNGKQHVRKVNVQSAAERLALSEFNTWYVRGLAKRLMNEGVTMCQVYRAAMPKWNTGDCASHENKIYPVETIYRGHRARYWPVANSAAMSIPFGPNCHHSIRRYLSKP